MRARDDIIVHLRRKLSGDSTRPTTAHESGHRRRHRISRQRPRVGLGRGEPRRPRADAIAAGRPGAARIRHRQTRHYPYRLDARRTCGGPGPGARRRRGAGQSGRRVDRRPALVGGAQAGAPRQPDSRDALAGRGAWPRRSSRRRIFLSASGVGYYGDRGSEPLTEEASPGDDFLAHLCVEWEAEAGRAAMAARGGSCCCAPAWCSKNRAASCRR